MSWINSDTGWAGIIGGALQGIGQVLAPQQPSYGYPSAYPTYPTYPSYPQLPPSYGGFQTAAVQLPSIISPDSPFANLGLPGVNVVSESMLGARCINPTVGPQRLMWPSRVDVQAEPGKILTYVRAPRVSYKVSVRSRSRRRRGCH